MGHFFSTRSVVPEKIDVEVDLSEKRALIMHQPNKSKSLPERKGKAKNFYRKKGKADAGTEPATSRAAGKDANHLAMRTQIEAEKKLPYKDKHPKTLYFNPFLDRWL